MMKCEKVSKKCSICGEIKPLDDFHNNKQMKDGKHSQCKVCRNINSKKSYHSLTPKEKRAFNRKRNRRTKGSKAAWYKKPENHSRIKSKHNTQYKERRKQIIEQLGGVCSHPNCNCIENLQLDHINPLEKSFSISERISTWDIKKLQPEIDKCQLLCPKHHLEKTIEDAKKYGYHNIVKPKKTRKRKI